LEWPLRVASVCHAKTLLDALKAGTIELERGLRLVGNAVGERAYAAGNGISQLVGAPLRPGERLRVIGNIKPGTLLRVRVAVGERTADAVFRLPSTRSAVVSFGREGVTSLKLTDGHGTLHRPVELHLKRGMMILDG